MCVSTDDHRFIRSREEILALEKASKPDNGGGTHGEGEGITLFSSYFFSKAFRVFACAALKEIPLGSVLLHPIQLYPHDAGI